MTKSYVGTSVCFFCSEPKEVLLDRRLKNTLEQNMLLDLVPCDKCKELMELGIILISYDEKRTDFSETIKIPNPFYHEHKLAREKGIEDPQCDDKMRDTTTPSFYRTGGWCVVKESAVKAMLIDEPDIMANTIKKRVLFLQDEVWDSWGLPRGEEIDNRDNVEKELEGK